METVCLQIPHRKGSIPDPIIFIGVYLCAYSFCITGQLLNTANNHNCVACTLHPIL